MQVITQPEDGLMPILKAIKRARKSLDIVIFRFDLPDLEDALAAAVERGVAVRALIAHTNRGGEKKLRKLEDRLLKAGATLSRTADDMVRYHGKVVIVDNKKAFVLGFNFTALDVKKSRSFGLITVNPKIVAALTRVIDADHNRVPPIVTSPRLVVSPENAREQLSNFIRGARRELLIYDSHVTDDRIIAVLMQRAAAGVKIKVLGGLERKWKDTGIKVKDLRGLRLHVRAIIRDRKAAFVGSQSLRKLELDQRREVGMITKDKRAVEQIARTFESDWKA
ncbi:MAG TPA: phospholipase D-like domain-containing protein [Vicinamibacterales bacterium]|nr:phospholipase D-like domain-containing protein [Vicinamibacterales bacterium]